MKNILKKLACTALSGVLLMSALGFGSAAKSKITTRDIDKTNPMFRLYNPNSGEHFYTKDMAERDYLDKIGWNYEGAGWTAPKTSKTPVYRLYNPNAGEHHYTMSKSEKDMLIKAGWNYEGIGWYSDDNKATPVYRQYNPNAYACNHNYTKSKAENDKLISLGWKYEGMSWYGVEEMPVKYPATPEETKPEKPVEDKFVENYDFTEEDVKKMVEEMGFKYNYDLDPLTNCGWDALSGADSEELVPEIYNLQSVKETILYKSTKDYNEFRLIRITPENFYAYTHIPQGDKFISFCYTNPISFNRIKNEIYNGVHAYMLCYVKSFE